ncbi:MAG: hypothetical protein C0508_29220 [Cyanobacteria bacterium PR.023]|jgi:hypothetical protein|nr:hypothetical protein [Cyanobacteria bacterium PR.023]MDQ5933597.1 hypothetical protein [Cyanobacteriota bacterium erpe_2018_sw_21hr_WHONDRS-SW48-000092_B_bin.40]
MLRFSKLLCLLVAASICLFSCPGTSARPLKSSRATSARSAFLRQLVNPESRQNLGVAYFIELNRAGKLYKTNNKCKFRSGDQIRFHVFANADAYVYIIMRQGTKGTKSVLFPLAETGTDNLVKRGRDCIVPTESALQFDENPGVENVGLLLSRQKIAPELVLNYPANLIAYVPSIQVAKRKLPGRTKMSVERAPGGSLLQRQPAKKSGRLELDLVGKNYRGRQLWRTASAALRESNMVVVVKEGAGAVAVDFALIHEP